MTLSPWKAGLVAISSHVAPLVLSIFVGTWVEGRSKKKVAMISEFIRAVTMSLLAFIVFIDGLHVGVVALLLFIAGMAGLFYRVSISSMLPDLVGRHRLVDAHNYMEGADAVSTLIGPIMAGMMFAAAGAAWTISVDALSYVVSFIGIAMLVYPEKDAGKGKPRPSVKEQWALTLHGLRYLVGNGIQRFVTFNHAILNFTTHAVVLLVIVLAKQTLELSVAETGFLISAAGVGNVLGVFLMNKVKRVQWRWLYTVIMGVSAAGVLMLTFTDRFVWAFVGILIFDGALSMAFVVNGTARQAITPNPLLARVSSGGILVGGMVAILGNLYAASMAEWVGVRWALGICGGILAVSVVVSLAQRHLNQPLDRVNPIELTSN